VSHPPRAAPADPPRTGRAVTLRAAELVCCFDADDITPALEEMYRAMGQEGPRVLLGRGCHTASEPPVGDPP